MSTDESVMATGAGATGAGATGAGAGAGAAAGVDAEPPDAPMTAFGLKGGGATGSALVLSSVPDMTCCLMDCGGGR